MGSFFSFPECSEKSLCAADDDDAFEAYCNNFNTTDTCVAEDECKWGNLPKDSNWIIGVCFSLFSSLATCFGLILQKCAHIKNLERPPEKRAREINGIPLTWWWFSSFCLMVLLPLPFDFVAFGLASQSLLVPLAGVTLVLNQLIAPCILGEKLYRIDVYATAIILVGCTMTTATGNHTATSFTACDFLEMYVSTRFLVAEIVILWPLMTFCVINVKRPGYCGLPFAKPEWDAFFEKLHWLHPVFYAFTAAGFGCQQNVVFKVTGELAKASIVGDAGSGPWSYVFPYIHVFLIVTLAAAQIMWINKGLALFDAVLSLPLYNSFYIILSGTWGFIYFNEMKTFTTFQWVMFPLGICVTIAGILLMTSKREKGKEASPAVHPLGKVRLQLADVESSGSEDSEGGPGGSTRDFATSPIRFSGDKAGRFGGDDEDSLKAPTPVNAAAGGVADADAGAGTRSPVSGQAAGPGNGGNTRRVIPVDDEGGGGGDGGSGGGRSSPKIGRQNTWLSSGKHASITPKDDAAVPVWLSSRNASGGNPTVEDMREQEAEAASAAAVAADGEAGGEPTPHTPDRARSQTKKASASAESLRSAEDSNGSDGNGHSAPSTTLTLSPADPQPLDTSSAAAAASALVEAAIRDATPR